MRTDVRKTFKRYIVAANWKLHGTNSKAAALTRAIKNLTRRAPRHVEVVLAPPFTAIETVHRLIGRSQLKLAGQDVFWEEEGAFTGEVSPGMLLEGGCERVLIGHSERRRLFGETNQHICLKVTACARAGLAPIVCVGETLRERRANQTRQVLSRQLTAALKGFAKNGSIPCAVAYEPVWAIGTGRKATSEQIEDAHGWIRRILVRTLGNVAGKAARVLYGGSVNSGNAAELTEIAEVDGVLVGGASLEAKGFVSIVRSFEVAAERRVRFSSK